MGDSGKRGKGTKPRKIYEGIITMACSLLVYWEGQNNPNWRQVLRNVIDKKKKKPDGWMASSTQWTWVWARSGRWWGTWMPGVLQSMGLQRLGYDWVTEQQWTDKKEIILL